MWKCAVHVPFLETHPITCIRFSRGLGVERQKEDPDRQPGTLDNTETGRRGGDRPKGPRKSSGVGGWGVVRGRESGYRSRRTGCL